MSVQFAWNTQKTQKPGFFEKLMIDKLGPEIAGKMTLDWKNPRVVCIAESYSKFDIDTVEVVPLRIELLKYRYYEDGIFSLERINLGTDDTHETQVETVATIEKKEKVGDKDGSTVDSLIAKANPAIRLLFNALRERIRAMDEDIEEKATLFYVAYRLSNRRVRGHPLAGPCQVCKQNSRANSAIGIGMSVARSAADCLGAGSRAGCVFCSLAKRTLDAA